MVQFNIKATTFSKTKVNIFSHKCHQTNDSGLCGQTARGLVRELFQIFLPRIDRNKNIYMHFLAVFRPTWFWLVRLLDQCRQYTRTAYTAFWLVWPKTGLVRELFQIFLARIDRNKNSYMYFVVFSLLHGCGLCVCYTSAAYIQELPIPDSGLCGQKRDICRNYSKYFRPQ